MANTSIGIDAEICFMCWQMFNSGHLISLRVRGTNTISIDTSRIKYTYTKKSFEYIALSKVTSNSQMRISFKTSNADDILYKQYQMQELL